MAEALPGKVTLSCKKMKELRKMASEDIDKYSRKLKECTEENEVEECDQMSKLIDVLSKFEPILASHVHVVDVPETTKREQRGRQQRAPRTSQKHEDCDSGVSSATSQALAWAKSQEVAANIKSNEIQPEQEHQAVQLTEENQNMAEALPGKVTLSCKKMKELRKMASEDIDKYSRKFKECAEENKVEECDQMLKLIDVLSKFEPILASHVHVVEVPETTTREQRGRQQRVPRTSQKHEDRDSGVSSATSQALAWAKSKEVAANIKSNEIQPEQEHQAVQLTEEDQDSITDNNMDRRVISKCRSKHIGKSMTNNISVRSDQSKEPNFSFIEANLQTLQKTLLSSDDENEDEEHLQNDLSEKEKDESKDCDP